jgi:hypothetical protein
MYNIPNNIPKVVKKSEGAIFREVLLNLVLMFAGGVVAISVLLRLSHGLRLTGLTEFLWANWPYTLLVLVVMLFVNFCAANSREETRVREMKDSHNRLDWGW